MYQVWHMRHDLQIHVDMASYNNYKDVFRTCDIYIQFLRNKIINGYNYVYLIKYL